MESTNRAGRLLGQRGPAKVARHGADTFGYKGHLRSTAGFCPRLTSTTTRPSAALGYTEAITRVADPIVADDFAARHDALAEHSS
jgi:hypothetical protein